MPIPLRKAVITAAGHGTRMYPASNTVQKELFPLVDRDGFAKPVLQIIAEECVASGLDEICIVGNPANIDSIRDHFRTPSDAERRALDGKEWAMKLADQLAGLSGKISYAVQREQKGFGHAVYQAAEFAAGEPVLVLLGDHVYLEAQGQPRCAQQMVKAWGKYQSPISAVETIPKTLVAQSGVIRGVKLAASESSDVYKAEQIAEKPTPEYAQAHLRTPGLPDGQYLAHFGMHAFPPDLFDKLKFLIDHNTLVDGEIQLTSAEELLLRDYPQYIALPIAGKRLDMGQPVGYVYTQAMLALASQNRSEIDRAIAEARFLGVG